MVTAVSIVHGAGIIHRDLKPCNFLIVKGWVLVKYRRILKILELFLEIYYVITFEFA